MPCKYRNKPKAKSPGKPLISWRSYHKLWKKYNDRQFKVANSLSKKFPYGKNPVSGKPLKSAWEFANRLRQEEKMTNACKNLTKKAFKKQTGKNW